MPTPSKVSFRTGNPRSAMPMTATIGGLGIIGIIGIMSTVSGCETASDSTEPAITAADSAVSPADNLRNRTISPENDKSRARSEAWALALTGLSFEADADGTITEFFVAEPIDAMSSDDDTALVRQAEDHVQKGRLAAATQAWGNALRMKPTDASIAHGLAKTLARAGRMNEAGRGLRICR